MTQTQTAQTAEKLNDILAIMNDGVSFYDEAIEKVEDLTLKPVFTRYREKKRDLAQELSKQVAMRGEEPKTDGTFVGSMREGYAKLRTAFQSDRKALISELEEHEDHALHKLQDFISDDDAQPQTRTILENYVPEFRALHDNMKTLKQSVQ